MQEYCALSICVAMSTHVPTAYRLYTVVPRLINMIEDLTNWYIRFNRKRLKGEQGVPDTLQALNTLFDVLFTLARTMAPFTPFLTENMYQGLKQYIVGYAGVTDKQSIHFLDFPDVRQQYFDPAIVRAVGRMQTVIALGRNIRDVKNIVMKTPLRELVVLHDDEEFFADVRSLEKYILEVADVEERMIACHNVNELLASVRRRPPSTGAQHSHTNANQGREALRRALPGRTRCQSPGPKTPQGSRPCTRCARPVARRPDQAVRPHENTHCRGF